MERAGNETQYEPNSLVEGSEEGQFYLCLEGAGSDDIAFVRRAVKEMARINKLSQIGYNPLMILGLGEGATREEIEQKRKEISKIIHPDVLERHLANRDLVDVATGIFKKIENAIAHLAKIGETGPSPNSNQSQQQPQPNYYKAGKDRTKGHGAIEELQRLERTKRSAIPGPVSESKEPQWLRTDAELQEEFRRHGFGVN